MLMILSYLFIAFNHLGGKKNLHLSPHLAIWVLFIYLVINENFGRTNGRP